MLQFNWFGILLGFVFISSIGAFCYWAFRGAPALPPRTTSARSSRNRTSRVLVPVIPAALAESAVERACRWEPSRLKELVLVYVIVVPDILALDYPLPEQDQAADDALNRAYAIAKEKGLPARMYTVRQRNVADGLLQVAREEQTDVIMLSIGGAANSRKLWERTSGEVLRQANCEVIVDQAALAAPLTTATV